MSIEFDRHTFAALIMGATLGLGMTNASFASDVLVEKGEKVFKKCKACHMVGDKAKNKVGPQLNDIIGRPAGSLEGYKFSKAMEEKGDDGLVWTEETLQAYLEKPRKFVPKTKMAFSGLRKQSDLDAIIAYLKDHSE